MGKRGVFAVVVGFVFCFCFCLFLFFRVFVCLFVWFLVNTREMTVWMVCFQVPLILLTVWWRTLMSDLHFSHRSSAPSESSIWAFGSCSSTKALWRNQPKEEKSVRLQLLLVFWNRSAVVTISASRDQRAHLAVNTVRVTTIHRANRNLRLFIHLPLISQILCCPLWKSIPCCSYFFSNCQRHKT